MTDTEETSPQPGDFTGEWHPDMLRRIPTLTLRPSQDLGRLASDQYDKFPGMLRHLLRGIKRDQVFDWLGDPANHQRILEGDRRPDGDGQDAEDGDRKAAAAIARQVVETFEGFDYVVAPSGSCGGMMVKHYPELFDPEAFGIAPRSSANTPTKC